MSKLSDKMLQISGNFNVTKKSIVFFVIPIVVLLIAIIVFASCAAVNGNFAKGINLGLDFTGGTILTVELPDLDNDDVFKAESDKLVSYIESKGYECSEPQLTGSGSDAAIQIKYQNTTNGDDNIAIATYVNDMYPEIGATEISTEFVSGSAAQTLVKEALIAILVIWAVIFVYILIRFELWSGFAALLGLIHDVVMMVCFTIICRIEVNITYVAAIITIIAYSINNTIVIFDRIREHVKQAPLDLKNNTVEYVVNKSTGEMLGRSIGTTITTMIPIILLACVGTESLATFALPILFGLIAGTYSSIFVAPNFYVLFKGARIRKKFSGYVGAQKVAIEGASVDAKPEKVNNAKTFKRYKRK